MEKSSAVEAPSILLNYYIFRGREPNDLEPLGVKIVHALPEVWENPQDHLEVYVQYAWDPIGFDTASTSLVE